MEKNTEKRVQTLEEENDELRHQLIEAKETIEAIRAGEIDAIVVQREHGNELYTLQTADHVYRVFIEKMSEGALTVSEDGLILYCNSQFCRMIGNEVKSVIGYNLMDFIAAGSRQEFYQLLTAKGNGDFKTEVALIGAHGPVHVQLSLAPMEIGEQTAMSIIVTDLTRQKKNHELLQDANRQLEKSNHALQQFAHVASHDLKEPVRKISMFLERLREEFGSRPTANAEEYIAKIEKATGRMRAMIDGVLLYSSVEGERQKMQAVDLNELIDQIRSDMEVTIEQKAAILRAGPLPVVRGFPVLVYQLFYNLVNNALKFTHREVSPVIEIYCTDDGADSNSLNCSIEVVDNGIGFDHEYSEEIFETFSRLHSKDKYEGTGLGLALCKKIAERHGGKITARSGKSGGSVFTVSLPLFKSGDSALLTESNGE